MPSPKVRNIVFTGATGARNRGVEALVSTAVENIRGSNPNANITVVSSDANYDAAHLETVDSVIKDAPNYYRLDDIRRKLKYPLGLRKPSGVRRIEAAIGSADVVIATGGDVFSSDYGVPFLKRQLALIRYAQKIGKKTVFLAHSIGPFSTEAEIDLVKPVLEASSLVTLRESFSYRYVSEELCVKGPHLALTADVAFLMNPSSPNRLRILNNIIGIKDGWPYVVLAPSEGITSFATSKDIFDHDAAWWRTINAVLNFTDCHIVLLPHVQDLNPHNDDNNIVKRLIDHSEPNSRIHAAFGPLSASDFKAIVGGASLLISERMHACIAGLSQCVPTLTIGYSVKANGIMNDLLGDQAKTQKLLISVQEFSGQLNIDDTISYIWNARRDVEETLKAGLTRIKERALNNFTLLDRI